MMQVTKFDLVLNDGSGALAWEEVAIISCGRLLTIDICVFVTAPVIFVVLDLGDFVVLSMFFTFPFSVVILLFLL